MVFSGMWDDVENQIPKDRVLSAKTPKIKSGAATTNQRKWRKARRGAFCGIGRPAPHQNAPHQHGVALVYFF